MSFTPWPRTRSPWRSHSGTALPFSNTVSRWPSSSTRLPWLPSCVATRWPARFIAGGMSIQRVLKPERIELGAVELADGAHALGVQGAAVDAHRFLEQLQRRRRALLDGGDDALLGLRKLRVGDAGQQKEGGGADDGSLEHQAVSGSLPDAILRRTRRRDPLNSSGRLLDRMSSRLLPRSSSISRNDKVPAMRSACGNSAASSAVRATAVLRRQPSCGSR